MPSPAAARESASVHHLPNALPEHPDNPGVPFDPEPVAAVRVNLSAVERRAATLPTRRTVKKEWQAAWLVRAIECIDLTTLSGDDTEGRVERLCAKARKPLREDLQDALGLGRPPHHRRRGLRLSPLRRHREARRSKASGIPVAAVSTAFPAGLAPFETRLREIEASVADGADEIDIGDHPRACAQGRLAGALRRGARLQGGLRPGAHEDHPRHRRPRRRSATSASASMVAMMAGSDFIKTSTGKEGVNATHPGGAGHGPRHPAPIAR